MSEVENTAASDNPSGVVSSLSEIKARLTARRERDLTKLSTHEHEALGKVYISFLPADGYHAIEAASMPQEAWAVGTDHAWKPEDIQKNINDKLDRAYLKYGVISGDNKHLDNEMIDWLLSGDFGAENRKLINAIKEKNPPREYLFDAIEKIVSCNQWLCLFFELLEHTKGVQKLRDFMLADDDSEECKALVDDFNKWEAAMPEVIGFMRASDMAKKLGMGIYDREPKETE